MKKFRENMSVLFGVIFIMSMFMATGAIESNQWLLGGVMVISGIFTGILTIILQSNQ